MDFSSGLLLVALIAIPTLICIAILHLFKAYTDKRRVIPFDIESMPRMPGHGLLSQLLNKTFDLAALIMFLMLSALIPLAQTGLQVYIGNPVASPTIIISLSIVLFLFFTFKIVSIYKVRVNLREGLEAEWAVGMKLNELQALGYKVFHDIQGDKFNIDHLVVGYNGVFAVETKSRRKPMIKNSGFNSSKERTKQFTVMTKGNCLKFPTWQDSKSIEQAKRQAKWVSTWLSNSTGLDINSSPVLIIPGWFIEHKEKPLLPVLALNQIGKSFPTLQGKPLNDKDIKQVCYQINQRVMRGNSNL